MGRESSSWRSSLHQCCTSVYENSVVLFNICLREDSEGLVSQEPSPISVTIAVLVFNILVDWLGEPARWFLRTFDVISNIHNMCFNLEIYSWYSRTTKPSNVVGLGQSYRQRTPTCKISWPLIFFRSILANMMELSDIHTEDMTYKLRAVPRFQALWSGTKIVCLHGTKIHKSPRMTSTDEEPGMARVQVFEEIIECFPRSCHSLSPSSVETFLGTLRRRRDTSSWRRAQGQIPYDYWAELPFEVFQVSE